MNSDRRHAGIERRRSERFAIERNVRYRVLTKRTTEATGEGQTINISSRGVLFTSVHTLAAGLRVEMCISWPAQLNDKCALKLVVRGRVVRFGEGRAAIAIQQHEFRTLLTGTESANCSWGPEPSPE